MINCLGETNDFIKMIDLFNKTEDFIKNNMNKDKGSV